MKTGEYRGKDGRVYRWERSRGEGWEHQHLVGVGWIDFPVKDWPAAKVALDELVAKSEWVETNDHIRVTYDGGRAQQLYDLVGWQEIDAKSSYSAQGYRKGREVALAEKGGDKYAPKVRELVEAVGAMYWSSAWTPDEMEPVGKEWLRRVVSASRKLER
jgi:hypothetical protein